MRPQDAAGRRPRRTALSVDPRVARALVCGPMQQFLSRNRLSELLDRAASCRVVVVGDVMLDVYLSGDVERISPEAPVPVMRVRERRGARGGAGHVRRKVAAIRGGGDPVGN